MTTLKWFFLIALVIQILWVIKWHLGYQNLLTNEMPQLEQQTYAIMANIKYLIAITLYIAWRITPDSKS